MAKAKPKKRGRKTNEQKKREAKFKARIARIQKRIDGLQTRRTVRQRVATIGRCIFRATLFVVLAVLLTVAVL